MENKKISNLVVPMTKRTLSLLGAVTIMATGLSGCKGEVKNNNSSDINMTSSVTSEDETLESSVYEEIDSSNLEISSEVIDDTSKDNSEITSNNSSKVNSSSGNKVTSSNNTSSNKNNQTSNSTTNNNQVNNSTNSNQSNSSVVSTPSSKPNVKPTIPSSLTKDNINDVDVFNYYAELFSEELYPGALFTTYNYYYNNKLCTSNGGTKEFQVMLALLNYEYMSNETMYKLFGDLTLDEFKQYSYFLNYLSGYLSPTEVIYDMTKYSINKDRAVFLNQFQKEILNVRKNGYNKNMDNLLKNYFVNEKSNVKFGYTNKFVDYFMVNMSAQITNDIEFELMLKVMDAYFSCSDQYLNDITNIYQSFKGYSKKIN